MKKALHKLHLEKAIKKSKLLYGFFAYAWLFLQFKSEAYRQGGVDLIHRAEVELAGLVFKPLFVDSAYLLEQDYTVLSETALVRLQFDMRGKAVFVALAGYRRRYHRRTVAIPDVVLYDKYRSHAALLRADYRTEVCIVYFSSFN